MIILAGSGSGIEVRGSVFNILGLVRVFARVVNFLADVAVAMNNVVGPSKSAGCLVCVPGYRVGAQSRRMFCRYTSWTDRVPLGIDNMGSGSSLGSSAIFIRILDDMGYLLCE